MFRDDEWPYAGFEDTFALTTLTYDTATGELYDADIEINTFGIVFTTTDSDVVYDLASTLQHETGHFLGIAHSPEVASPMFPLPEFGITRRELSADDVAAICDIYPPAGAELDASCSPAPHDFTPYCNHTLPQAPQTEAGCSTSSAPRGAGGVALLTLAALCAYAFRRRGSAS
jgi:MYXO-CTERM domain-containing protein